MAVAAWEFGRFFKLRDQVVSLAVGLAIGFGLYGVKKLIDRQAVGSVRVVVLNREALPLAPKPGGRVALLDGAGRTEDDLRAAVGRREIDALLIVRDRDRADLLVRKEPVWRPELSEVLDAARRRAALDASRLSPAQLANILAPVELTVTVHESGTRLPGRAEKITAGVLIALMLTAIFLGFSYFFTGITGEKQLRVTEQVVSAISPQTWIDGKLLGITGTASLSTLVFGLTVAIVVLTPRVLGGGSLTIPTLAPGATLLFLALAVLGILFWNCFFGAVAATISDPNTSSRSSMMMLPLLPVGLAFITLGKPDAIAVRVLAILPGTSSAVLPARLLLTDVASWEIVLAFGLLAGAIVFLRRLAGRIFAVAMLIYGKEPRWREVLRWAREA
jgi:ABC-2 type transport system permease protein